MRHPLAKHPLAGAYARIDRADRHLDELKLVIERFRKAEQDKLISQHQRVPWQLLGPGDKITGVLKSRLLNDFPLDAAVVVGEVIYNLRAALDYLIYELAWEDSGTEKHGTQFLIESVEVDRKDKKRGFNPRSETCFAGLRADHINALELLQPYKGCTWTKTLRDISNPDKHRRLTAIGGTSEALSTVECGISENLNDRPRKILRGRGASYADTHTHLQYTLQVTLPNGADIVKTLEILKREVRATIDAFKPEFKV
jgi:hypothetical protein